MRYLYILMLLLASLKWLRGDATVSSRNWMSKQVEIKRITPFGIQNNINYNFCPRVAPPDTADSSSNDTVKSVDFCAVRQTNPKYPITIEYSSSFETQKKHYRIIQRPSIESRTPDHPSSDRIEIIEWIKTISFPTPQTGLFTTKRLELVRLTWRL